MSEAPLRLKALISKYPRLFASANVIENISLPDGWLGLFDLLCERIETILEENPAATIQVLQVKAKFAELRVYFCLDEQNSQLRHSIRQSIALATEVSQQCCEKCGGPGKIIGDGGWMRVRCNDCD